MNPTYETYVKQDDTPIKEFQTSTNLTEVNATNVRIVTSEVEAPYNVVIDREVDSFQGEIATIHFQASETASVGEWNLAIKADIPTIGTVTFPERDFVKLYIVRNP